MYQKKFSKEKFKVFHPGGNIGKSLLLAKDIMLIGKNLPIANYKKNLGEIVKIMNKKKLGVVILLKKKFIAGLVTDGDLRRELNFISKKTPLQKFMTKKPLTVHESMPAVRALGIMNEKKITSLLVVKDKDQNKKNNLELKGMIHIHSLLQLGLK